MVPTEVHEPGLGPKGPTKLALERASKLWIYLTTNCVGWKQAKPSPFIARSLGFYAARDRKDRGVRLRYLVLLLIAQGRPVCSRTGGRQGGGIYVAVTRREIDVSVAYLRRQASGFLDSAEALDSTEPFQP